MRRPSREEQNVGVILRLDESGRGAYIKEYLKAHPDVDSQLGYSKFEIKSDAFAEILSQARTLPLGSLSQLFLIKINRKISSDEVRLLEAYAASPASHTVLIFEDELGFLEKSGFKLPHGWKLISINGFAKPPKQVILQLLETQQKKISSSALEMLVAKCLQGEVKPEEALEMLLLYISERELITDEDVAKIIPDAVSYGSFDLAEALLAHRFDRVLEICRASLESGTSVQEVLGMIHWQMKRIYEAKVRLSRGDSQQQVAADLGIRPYYAADFFLKAAKFKLSAAEDFLQQLSAMDFSIKSGKTSPVLGLEQYLVASMAS